MRNIFVIIDYIVYNNQRFYVVKHVQFSDAIYYATYNSTVQYSTHMSTYANILERHNIYDIIDNTALVDHTVHRARWPFF